MTLSRSRSVFDVKRGAVIDRRSASDRNVWRSSVVAALWIFLVTATATADDYDAFRAAREAFRRQDYAAAAEGLDALVGGAVPRVEGPLRLEVRKYLGASCVFLGRQEEAVSQFEALLREDPQHELDPVAFSSDVVALFGSVRDRLATAVAEETRRAEAAVEAARAADQARIAELELALIKQSTALPSPPSRWIAAIPFGPGQLQNGDALLGWFFAGAGALAGLASIVAAVLYQTLTNELADAVAQGDTSQFRPIQDARDGALLANRLAFASLGAVAIASIVDAQVRFRSEVGAPPAGRLAFEVSPLAARLKVSF